MLLPLLPLLITTYLADLGNCQAFQIVQPTDTEAGALTSYLIQALDFTTTIPTAATMLLVFPQQFSPTELKANSPFALDLAASFCPSGDCSTVGVSYSGLAVKFTGLFPFSSLINLEIYLSGVPNPSAGMTTDSFGLYFFNSLDAQIYYASVPGVSISSKPMSCSAVTISYNVTTCITSAYFEI